MPTTPTTRRWTSSEADRWRSAAGRGWSSPMPGAAVPVPGDHVVGHMTPGKGPGGAHRDLQQRRRTAAARTSARSFPRAGRHADRRRVRDHPGDHREPPQGRGRGTRQRRQQQPTRESTTSSVDERSAELSLIRLEMSVQDKEHLERVRQRLLSDPGRSDRGPTGRSGTRRSKRRERRQDCRGNRRRTPVSREGGAHRREAPAAIGTYSQAVWRSTGTVYLSGQIPLDPANPWKSSPTTRGAQVEQVLANLAKPWPPRRAAVPGGYRQAHRLPHGPRRLRDGQRSHGGALLRALSGARRRRGRRATARRPGRNRRGPRPRRLMSTPDEDRFSPDISPRATMIAQGRETREGVASVACSPSFVSKMPGNT